MYIMITSRCNMLCEHCCGDYGPEGEDMDMETFKAALNFAESYGFENIAIGGGEPTVHPQFWEMLGLAVLWGVDVWLATNGKRKKDALRLAKAAEKRIVAVDLSLDEWHEPIDYEVSDAFRVMHEKTKSALFWSVSIPFGNREMPLLAWLLLPESLRPTPEPSV